MPKRLSILLCATLSLFTDLHAQVTRTIQRNTVLHEQLSALSADRYRLTLSAGDWVLLRVDTGCLVSGNRARNILFERLQR